MVTPRFEKLWNIKMLFSLKSFQLYRPSSSHWLSSSIALSVSACLFSSACNCVCVCVCMLHWVSLRTLETPKSFQGPRVLHCLPLFLFLSHDVFHLTAAVSFFFHLLASRCPFPFVSRTKTKQQPPPSLMVLNFKDIMALTGHTEQAANAAAARHGKQLITWSRITLISVNCALASLQSVCCFFRHTGFV